MIINNLMADQQKELDELLKELIRNVEGMRNDLFTHVPKHRIDFEQTAVKIADLAAYGLEG